MYQDTDHGRCLETTVLPVPDDLPNSGDFLHDAKFFCIQGIAQNLPPIWKGGASSLLAQQNSQLAEQPPWIVATLARPLAQLLSISAADGALHASLCAVACC